MTTCTCRSTHSQQSNYVMQPSSPRQECRSTHSPTNISVRERRLPNKSFGPVTLIQRAYKYVITRFVLSVPEGDSRIHSSCHSRTHSSTNSTSEGEQLDSELLKSMLLGTSNASSGSSNVATGAGKQYGMLPKSGPTNNGRWMCKCITALFLILFITFWLVIIFYASARDKPLNIVVRDDYPLPEIKPRFDAKGNQRVPLLFHQMWKSPQIPAKWHSAHEGCVTMNEEYELIFWTDEMLYNFIARHYTWFFKIFVNYLYHIQRVDVSRYFILYHYGGVYLDVDAACRTPFREIVRNMTSTEAVLLPMTDIYGVTNSFMVAEPKSEFFKYVTYELPSFAHGHYNLVRHTTIIFSTGPMFMSHCVTTFQYPETIHVMTLSDYDEKHFYHAKSGSWHGMDTEIVDAFHFHYIELLIITCIVICTLLVCRYRGQLSGGGSGGTGGAPSRLTAWLCCFGARRVDVKALKPTINGHVRTASDLSLYSNSSSSSHDDCVIEVHREKACLI